MKTHKNIRPIIVADRTIDTEFKTTFKLIRNKEGLYTTQDIQTGKKYKTMSIMFSPTYCNDDGLNMYDALIMDQHDQSILVGIAAEDLVILEQLREWINSGKLDFCCMPEEPVATVATPTETQDQISSE